MKPHSIILILLLIVIIPTAGLLIPKTMINTNVSNYQGEQGLVAPFAINTSKQLFGGSLESLIITGFSVEEVLEVENNESQNHPGCRLAVNYSEESFTTKRSYEATVQSFTIFGVPYKKIKVDCSGAAWVL